MGMNEHKNTLQSQADCIPSANQSCTINVYLNRVMITSNTDANFLYQADAADEGAATLSTTGNTFTVSGTPSYPIAPGMFLWPKTQTGDTPQMVATVTSPNAGTLASPFTNYTAWNSKQLQHNIANQYSSTGAVHWRQLVSPLTLAIGTYQFQWTMAIDGTNVSAVSLCESAADAGGNAYDCIAAPIPVTIQGQTSCAPCGQGLELNTAAFDPVTFTTSYVNPKMLINVDTTGGYKPNSFNAGGSWALYTYAGNTAGCQTISSCGSAGSEVTFSGYQGIERIAVLPVPATVNVSSDQFYAATGPHNAYYVNVAIGTSSAAVANEWSQPFSDTKFEQSVLTGNVTLCRSDIIGTAMTNITSTASHDCNAFNDGFVNSVISGFQSTNGYLPSGFTSNINNSYASGALTGANGVLNEVLNFPNQSACTILGTIQGITCATLGNYTAANNTQHTQCPLDMPFNIDGTPIVCGTSYVGVK
jgi:hypothetical protein